MPRLNESGYEGDEVFEFQKNDGIELDNEDEHDEEFKVPDQSLNDS